MDNPNFRRDWMVSVRPKHWVKNVLVFAAPAFAHALTDPMSMLKTVWVFVIFCALASSSYLLNDLIDATGDREHPMKKNRPIAAGRLSVPATVSLTVLLTVAGLAAAMPLGRAFFWVAATFVILHALYSAILQNVVIVDVFALSANYVLRVVAGAVALDVPMSPWLLICTMLLSLFLGLSARSLDFKLLKEGASRHRAILEHYNPYLLDQMIAVITSAILVTYTLYAISPDAAARFHSTHLPLTIPFVLYGILRYLYLIHQGEVHPSLERALISDKPMRRNAMLYGLVVFGIIYL